MCARKKVAKREKLSSHRAKARRIETKGKFSCHNKSIGADISIIRWVEMGTGKKRKKSTAWDRSVAEYSLRDYLRNLIEVFEAARALRGVSRTFLSTLAFWSNLHFNCVFLREFPFTFSFQKKFWSSVREKQ